MVQKLVLHKNGYFHAYFREFFTIMIKDTDLIKFTILKIKDKS